MRILANAFLFGVCVSDSVPRNVRIDGRQFIEAKTGQPIVLGGPNVVVKGPPYLPAVSGNEICNDVTDHECQQNGNCTSCFTFNQADVDHIKSLGWNFIRLGVVWAGAQPRDEDSLDPDFIQRLHDILNLTDRNGLHVMLDNHGDMVGSAGCGNGAPMWFQKLAAPELIGQPLETHFPYNLIGSLEVKNVHGYNHCGTDKAKWAAHAGDPNYNLLNECCLAMNSGNPGGLGFTSISQATMDYMIKPGAGRDAFARYWRLMAEAVRDHPSAFAFELANEPMTIRRRWYFQTWKHVAEAIVNVVPDASISIADTGEGAVFPAWFIKFTGFHQDIPKDVMEWIRTTNNAFYAWHYGTVPHNIRNMQAVSEAWNVPTFGTELSWGSCDEFEQAAEANISHSYWHYSCYCNTGPAFGNKQVPEETFGGCILGWGAGNSSHCAHSKRAAVKKRVVFENFPLES